MIYEGKTNEYFEIEAVEEASKNTLNVAIGDLKDDTCKSILWIQEGTARLLIDAVPYTFEKDDVIFLTQFHRIEVQLMCPMKVLRFNRPFFCIADHDSEVGCRGILFFGATNVPAIRLSGEEEVKFRSTWQLMEKEFDQRDSLQMEILRTLLKSVLIFATRIYKKQTNYQTLDKFSTDIIRSFNFLVEEHFREKHSVAAYAALLFKSPKTLANIFSKSGNKTPSQFIYARIMTEARRMLRYTDMPVADIGYYLGFTDVQAFSRFFTNNEGISPSQFRDNKY